MMISTAETETIAFRAPRDFVEETKRFAGKQPISQYIRDAVREKNERQMAARIRYLSGRLAKESAAVNSEFDETLGDGIAEN
jgi:hypothetical protein